MLWWGRRHPRETVTRIEAAFPASLADDVRMVLRCLPVVAHELTPDDIGPVVVEGESLAIPYRVYFPEPSASATARLTERQLLVMAAVLTRHHDGFIRERRARELLASHESWVVPFIVQLLGEYVIEIAEAVAVTGVAAPGDYGRFADANPAFCAGVCARIISYWNEYYRRAVPDFAHYTFYRAALALGVWNIRVPRRRRAG